MTPERPDPPVLYSFRRCPYAMRARMALNISKTSVRLREVLLRDKPDEMIAASSKGTVPVLIDKDSVVDESLAVMHWALAKSDPEEWLAGSPAESLALIEENDGEFKHHLDRYKYASRYEGADALTHRREAMKFIVKLEKQLTGRAYLFGDQRSFADIAIFPFIRQFRIADSEWFDAAPIPKVRAWLKGLMESDLFISVMRKYPVWKETKEEFLFPEDA